MNDPIPPTIPTPSLLPQPILPPPEDVRPVTGMINAIECMLRQPGRVFRQLSAPDARAVILALTGIGLGAALVYGFVMGTFSGGAQLWAAPVKLAAGLVLSALICLPSLYIFSCLGGSTARLSEVTGLLAGLVALMTILLIGFAPVAWVFSQSTESLVMMGALHLVFMLVAVGFGLRFLFEGFARLAGRSSDVLKLWALVFMLVLLQMSAALRPLIGTSGTFLPEEKKSFLAHWGDNIRQQQARERAKAHARPVLSE